MNLIGHADAPEAIRIIVDSIRDKAADEETQGHTDIAKVLSDLAIEIESAAFMAGILIDPGAVGS